MEHASLHCTERCCGNVLYNVIQAHNILFEVHIGHSLASAYFAFQESTLLHIWVHIILRQFYRSDQTYIAAQENGLVLNASFKLSELSITALPNILCIN